MMRLFRSLLVFLALLALSAGGSWNVANAHAGQMHMPQQAMSHHHAAGAAQAGDHNAHHQHQAEATMPCLDASAPSGDERPDHMGSLCCAAMACHMAVLPQTALTVSAVAIRAANPLPLETTVEGTLGPRLERPPRSLAV